jgi:hypothetical protein
MQIPIINGIYTNDSSDFRTSYPVNLIPVPKQNGISSGYLRPADGIVHLADVDGIDRGGINWNGLCYRVCGENLIRINENNSIDIIGSVGFGGQCHFDYSFDYLAINSNRKLFLYNGLKLKQITDSDIGLVKDVVWVDGYFMTTDGTYLIVTELTDPFQVNPLKYGSAEVDPDPINALMKIRNEVYALGRYTIEVFDNVGGDLFPFARVDGAMIPKGTISATACCNFLENIAFVGSGRNEPIGIYVGSSANAQKISNREIDQILHTYSEGVLSTCLLESRSQEGHNWIYYHLPDQTLVYDFAATQEMGSPVWFKLSTGVELSQYTAKNHVWCYDKWIIGHPSLPKLGTLTNNSSHHWGDVVAWSFDTAITYNESRGAIFHQIELVSLTGRVSIDKNPEIYTQYSLDGETWSQPKFIKSGRIGQRAKRLVWLQQGSMNNWRIQRFVGTSDSHISIARLEAQLEPLAV